MDKLQRVAVFCGSSTGKNQQYQDTAYNLGKEMALRDLDLIYGGSKIGLMGAIADGILQSGGDAYGVLPDFLDHREIAHDDLTELIRVDSMHERKTKMHELSDGVIALPGGFGTLEELFEMVTWSQLGIHTKPIGVLNINGYFNHLKAFAQYAIEEGFVHEKNHSLLLFCDSIDELFQRMESFEAPPSDLDISLKET